MKHLFHRLLASSGLALALSLSAAHAAAPDLPSAPPDAAHPLPSLCGTLLPLQGHSRVHKVIALADGGLAAAGIVQGEATYADAWMARFHPDGRLAWIRTLIAPRWQSFWDIAQHRSGEIYAVGADARGGHENGWIVRFGSDGKIRRTSAEGAREENSWAAIASSRDGGVIVAGGLDDPATRMRTGRIAGLGAQGEILWEVRTPAGMDATLAGLTALRDGGVVAVGYAKDGNGQPHALAIKLDRHRKIDWLMRQNAAGKGYTSAVELPDGRIAVSGAVFGGKADDSAGGLVAMMEPSGAIRWESATPGHAMAQVAFDGHGRLIAVGMRDEPARNARSAILVLDTDGTLVHRLADPSEAGSTLWSVVISGGRVILAGEKSGAHAPNTRHAWLTAVASADIIPGNASSYPTCPAQD